MAETIHLAIPVDGANYRKYAEVTVASVLRGSSLPIEVHYIDWSVVDRSRLEKLGSWHGSAVTWTRLWLPELYPKLDWILSSDADVMFRGDLAVLWKMRDDSVWCLPSRDSPFPLQQYNKTAIAWYQDRDLVFEKPQEYFCAGLTLFNLKAMREGGWAERRDAFLAAYEAESMPNADQCVLNYLLQDRKNLLPRGWGAFSGDENMDIDWSNPGAVHYVEDPPWRRYKITHLASDLVEEWWQVARQYGIAVPGGGYRGCCNWFDWAWRRTAFVFLKYNQWILKLHFTLWLHLRSTRGVRT